MQLHVFSKTNLRRFSTNIHTGVRIKGLLNQNLLLHIFCIFRESKKAFEDLKLKCNKKRINILLSGLISGT